MELNYTKEELNLGNGILAAMNPILVRDDCIKLHDKLDKALSEVERLRGVEEHWPDSVSDALGGICWEAGADVIDQCKRVKAEVERLRLLEQDRAEWREVAEKNLAEVERLRAELAACPVCGE